MRALMRSVRPFPLGRTLLGATLALVMAVTASACSDDEPPSGATAPTTAAGGSSPSATGPLADALELRATLTPEAVVPTPGVAGPSGTATLTFDAEAREVCGTFELAGLDEVPLNIYVQQAPAGERGPLVVRFELDRSSDAMPIEACGPVEDDRGTALVADPEGSYVQVDTRSSPGGALRGQLSRAATG